MKKVFILMAALSLTATGFCQKKKNAPNKKATPEMVANDHQCCKANEVKNIIFIVGDGMGVAQVYSSVVGQKGDSQFLRFPFSGFSRTYSNNKYTTDSGAGGTALMTGHKVDNHHIAVGPDGKWYPSFVQTAHNHGKKAGIVVTCHIVDATPASTYGHVTDRGLSDSLSMQMANCGFEVMIGGKRSAFLPQNRKDGKAPLDTMAARGYTLAYSIDDMMSSKGDKLCALLSEENPGKAPERNGMLTKGTQKALSMLNSSKDGFVMMIEGSQIDWACHNNDSTYLRQEMEDFESMLKVVLDFAEQDGNTLVVVTADHETGGLVLTGGDIESGENTIKWCTGSHSGVMVPVFAFGPSAHLFSGIHQNTDFAPIFLNLLGL